MNEKLNLTKLIFEVEGGLKISLSLKEARDLYDQLHAVVGGYIFPGTPIADHAPRKPFESEPWKPSVEPWCWPYGEPSWAGYL